MKNHFKNGIEPALDVISSTIGRDAKPIRKLNPPKFEESLISLHNPNIAWGFSLEKQTSNSFTK